MGCDRRGKGSAFLGVIFVSVNLQGYAFLLYLVIDGAGLTISAGAVFHAFGRRGVVLGYVARGRANRGRCLSWHYGQTGGQHTRVGKAPTVIVEGELSLISLPFCHAALS